jgi:hypothetical protein
MLPENIGRRPRTRKDKKGESQIKVYSATRMPLDDHPLTRFRIVSPEFSNSIELKRNKHAIVINHNKRCTYLWCVQCINICGGRWWLPWQKIVFELVLECEVSISPTTMTTSSCRSIIVTWASPHLMCDPYCSCAHIYNREPHKHSTREK